VGEEDEEEYITERQSKAMRDELSRSMEEILAEVHEGVDPFAERVRYTSVKNDAVDELLGRFIERNNVRIPIHRIEKGSYLFGTKKVAAVLKDGRLLIRVGGGFMSLEEYFDKNADKEQEKLKTLMAKEKKKLDEVVKMMLKRYKKKRFNA